MQLTIGTWSLAVGLEWLIPTSSQEISDAKKERKDDMFVLAKQSHMSWLGFHPKTLQGTHAAALLVGLIKPNAVVVQTVSDTMSWVCCIRDRVPLAGRDLVLPHDQANQMSREWYGRSEAATLVGDHRSASSQLAAVFAELDQALANKTVRKSAIKSATLKPVGFQFKKALQFGAVGLVAVLTSLGIRHIQTEQSTKPDVNAQQAAQSQVDASARAAEVAHASRVNQDVQARQVAEMAARYSNRISPVDFWNAVSSLRAQLPISQFGFRPVSQNCTTTVCSVNWQAQGKLVRMSDKLRLPNVEPNYAGDLMATSRFDIQSRSESMPDLKATSPSELQLMLRSEMALHFPSAQVGDVKEQVVAPPAATGLKPIIVAYAGSWSVQLTGPTALVSATALAAALERLPVALTAINYDKQAQRVDFTGEYGMLAPPQ